MIGHEVPATDKPFSTWYAVGSMRNALFEVVSMDEHEPEYKHWETRSVEERINGLEELRERLYDFDPTHRGLSRFFEVVDRP